MVRMKRSVVAAHSEKTCSSRAASPLSLFLPLALLALLVTRSNASAAVAVDGTSTSSSTNASSLTFSKTVGSGSNRLLLVGISTKGNQNATGVTYGGVAMSRVLMLQNADWVEVWRLVAPATGTANVVITLTGGANFSAGAISFTGVDQGAPLGGVNITSGSSTAPSVTVNSRAGDMVFDVMITQDAGATAPAAGASQTSQWSQLKGDWGAASTHSGSLANLTNSWTTANQKWVDAAVNVRAAGINP